ncbi:oligosaccharide flippase family protein [Yoonia sp. F2084L]|uniref:oligosaccharide flippase family protein n=1 Tax=Yoonia sp. F2084L TaxID=2926419 RepID=UPI001FF4166F|nr:oligosaccharide flippase family protein [Yoonia sp. F2084L]MCK0093982.1 oligosaccharide flippase family protein [Yoonia sp. F2084L]
MTDPTPQPAPQPVSLGRRVLKAGSWSLVQVVVVNGLRLASNLIMTRLLLPDAFGLMAMVGILIAGMTLFTDIGINRSVAREPDGDQDHFLRAAWVFRIFQSILIASGVLLAAVCLWTFAPTYAAPGSVYADPRLPGLVAISAIVPLMFGAESMSFALAMRNLKLQYVTVISIITQAIQIGVMIVFASFSPTVWALLAGMMTGTLLKSVASHLFVPGPRMGFVWDREIALRLWHYGKWLMGSSIFSFVALNADRIILGGLMSVTLFGIFVIAQIWIGTVSMVIGRLIDQVGFPTISEMIRTRPKDVPRLYRKLQTGVDVMCIAAFLTMLFGGQLLIDLLYTDTYETAGRYTQILSLSFLTLRFYSLNTLIMNIGKSKEMMFISAMRAASICVLLPLAYHYLGLDAALLVVALNPLISSFYALSLLRPFLGEKQVRFDLLWVLLTLLIAASVFYYI